MGYEVVKVAAKTRVQYTRMPKLLAATAHA